MEWKFRERIPMRKGSTITLAGCKIVNDDEANEVSQGSTCLVYHGHVESGPGIIAGTRVIIKEFYPKSDEDILDFDRNEDGKLSIEGITREKTEYKQKRTQFMQGIDIQKELAKSDAMEVAVKPWLEGQWGDSYYVISDIHMGQDIKSANPITLHDKILVSVCIAETMDILHNAGYLMLDFKPENLMYIDKPHMVRILDVDSVVKYNEENDEGRALFGNMLYASPELATLYAMKNDYISEVRFQAAKRNLLKPISDVYSIGSYLKKLILEENPSFEDDEFDAEALLAKFLEMYKEDANISRKKLEEIGKRVISIIKKATIYNREKRKRLGYKSAADLMSALNEVYYMLTSDTYVPRKEIAHANATFAAYNMLQKYPLFQYATQDVNQEKCLNVAMVGSHAMRQGMLSALISIGQMLNTRLCIYMAAKDAENFWDQFTSEENNAALKSAVTWTKDGVTISDSIDKDIVARALAEIHLVTDVSESKILELSEKNSCGYFILIDEEESKNVERLSALRSIDFAEHIFVGCLHMQDDSFDEFQDEDSSLDVFPISAESFSECYNEKMFEERIYKMGLMAHAYYCGCMNDNASVDMNELEKEFRQDVYNISSSERCALHSIYKMASIGLDKDKPGRFLSYYKKIQDADCLEQLAWLEHLSWTGYMLTSGAKPISTSELDRYAYKNGNDWKNKQDSEHIQHPLLVASSPRKGLEADNLELVGLDPLDRVSYEIFSWYKNHKSRFKEELLAVLEEWETSTEQGEEMRKELMKKGLECIERIGMTFTSQDMKPVLKWKYSMEKAIKYAKEENSEKLNDILEKMNRVMKPVLDSYKDRDYKKLDRDLVFAVIDMIA